MNANDTGMVKSICFYITLEVFGEIECMTLFIENGRFWHPNTCVTHLVTKEHPNNMFFLDMAAYRILFECHKFVEEGWVHKLIV